MILSLQQLASHEEPDCYYWVFLASIEYSSLVHVQFSQAQCAKKAMDMDLVSYAVRNPLQSTVNKHLLSESDKQKT